MPGRADYRTAPGAKRLQAAMQALAQFHLAASSFPRVSAGSVEPSPGIGQRLEQLAKLQAGGYHKLTSAIEVAGWATLRPRAERLLEFFPSAARHVQRLLSDAKSLRTPLQPCIRDVWHDHILFEQDEVTAIIDFGALRIESVAADIARLLGSLAQDNADDWRTGQAAYESVRPLCEAQRQLVVAFDRSATLLGPLNWLTWIYLEGRQFEDHVAIEERLDAYIQRLTKLCSTAT
jgi:Ser/Thr protein kinase RdoA (MazF antagonist)